MRRSFFRFYQELNDFLPRNKRKVTFPHEFPGSPSVKDVIEAQGIPHTEVDLILVNGDSVSFDYLLKGGERISVYPVFESLNIGSLQKLRPEPLRETAFILDVHLGRLARYLRLAGFDTYYEREMDDQEIAEISSREGRIVLTRDVGLLKRKIITRGYWVRSQDPEEQLKEVVRRFDLSLKQFLRRCAKCNGIIREVSMDDVSDLLEANTKRYYRQFFQCSSCGSVYWEGTHTERIKELFSRVFRVEIE